MADIVFPDDYELISFFEREHELLDFDIPWFYNIITFQREYADEFLYCSFSPSYRDKNLKLVRNQKTKLVLSLHNIITTKILKDCKSEYLKMSFSEDSLSQNFLLTLKPEISIIWETKIE